MGDFNDQDPNETVELLTNDQSMTYLYGLVQNTNCPQDTARLRGAMEGTEFPSNIFDLNGRTTAYCTEFLSALTRSGTVT